MATFRTLGQLTPAPRRYTRRTATPPFCAAPQEAGSHYGPLLQVARTWPGFLSLNGTTMYLCLGHAEYCPPGAKTRG